MHSKNREQTQKAGNGNLFGILKQQQRSHYDQSKQMQKWWEIRLKMPRGVWLLHAELWIILKMVGDKAEDATGSLTGARRVMYNTKNILVFF